ncbi:MAG TPA: hypothetical protein VHY35_05325 [Stellaceae bacterium]|jgi:hypothetical protein|nr:hypothetical protein [Stellaceae bacterium]
MNSITVNIHRPPGTQLGTIMNEIRTWLDTQKIQPIEFKQAVGQDGIRFELRFREQAEADRFQEAF